MKKLSKVLFVLAFAFILTKIQIGTGEVFYSNVGGTTADPTQAMVFQTMHDVYEMQNNLNDVWEIKALQ